MRQERHRLNASSNMPECGSHSMNYHSTAGLLNYIYVPCFYLGGDGPVSFFPSMPQSQHITSRARGISTSRARFSSTSTALPPRHISEQWRRRQFQHRRQHHPLPTRYRTSLDVRLGSVPPRPGHGPALNPVPLARFAGTDTAFTN